MDMESNHKEVLAKACILLWQKSLHDLKESNRLKESEIRHYSKYVDKEQEKAVIIDQ